MLVHFDEIEFHLTRELKSANSRLLIAVAWLTNPQIGQVLLDIKNKGIDVEIIVDDNSVNRNNKTIRQLVENNIAIEFIENLISSKSLMHHKFCVIDNKKVITGSYNWTINANSNDENIVIINDSDSANFYSQEFRRIIRTGKTNNKIALDLSDSNEMIDLIIPEFLEIIKTGVTNGQLIPGLLAKYENEKIKNKIRAINEEITNNLQSKIGSIFRYADLIAEYGIHFKKFASDDELAHSRYKFKRKSIENFDTAINEIFGIIKIRAIQVLILKYSNLFKRKVTDEEMKRILSVNQFLIKEKIQLAQELQMILIEL